jgi:hypothetical protein
MNLNNYKNYFGNINISSKIPITNFNNKNDINIYISLIPSLFEKLKCIYNNYDFLSSKFNNNEYIYIENNSVQINKNENFEEILKYYEFLLKKQKNIIQIDNNIWKQYIELNKLNFKILNYMKNLFKQNKEIIKSINQNIYNLIMNNNINLENKQIFEIIQNDINNTAICINLIKKINIHNLSNEDIKNFKDFQLFEKLRNNNEIQKNIIHILFEKVSY